MTINSERFLGCFEKRILSTIFRGVQESGMWRRRYIYELYHLYKEPDIVRLIKIHRLRWVGHIERMEEGQPTKHIFYQKPMGSRKRGRPRSRFKDQIEEDLRKLNIRNWKAKACNREEWNRLLEKAKTHQGL